MFALKNPCFPRMQYCPEQISDYSKQFVCGAAGAELVVKQLCYMLIFQVVFRQRALEQMTRSCNTMKS